MSSPDKDGERIWLMSEVKEITPQQWIDSFILGTAQFGMDYGITNKTGRLALHDSKSILIEAHKVGIRTLDTAVSYGESEKVLGNILSETRLSFDIITKIDGRQPIRTLTEQLEQSFRNLCVPRVSVLMVHNFEGILRKEVIDLMANLKEMGLIGKIGVSVYYPHQVEKILAADIGCGVVQMPYNVLDRRFDSFLPRLRSVGIEVHARSVFLQGLLLVDENSLDAKFRRLDASLRAINDLSRKNNIPKNALLLNYVMARTWPGKVVIGVSSVKEFRDNVRVHEYWGDCLKVVDSLNGLSLEDESLLIPSNWASL